MRRRPPVLDGAFEWFASIEAMFSTYRDDSAISAINGARCRTRTAESRRARATRAVAPSCANKSRRVLDAGEGSVSGFTPDRAGQDGRSAARRSGVEGQARTRRS